MPYMKLTSPSVSADTRARIARELTEEVVRLMTPSNGRGLSASELRERCTVHFTPYEPDAFAIGGRMMTERAEREVTMEFSDWGLNERRQRRLAHELTPLLARLFDLEGRAEHVNIRFHPYAPTDFAVAGCSWT